MNSFLCIANLISIGLMVVLIAAGLGEFEGLLAFWGIVILIFIIGALYANSKGKN